MCQRIRCEQCHKPTYAGCGKHIEQVLRGVTEADRCHCQRGKVSHGPVAYHGVSVQTQSVAVHVSP